MVRAAVRRSTSTFGRPRGVDQPSWCSWAPPSVEHIAADLHLTRWIACNLQCQRPMVNRVNPAPPGHGVEGSPANAVALGQPPGAAEHAAPAFRDLLERSV